MNAQIGHDLQACFLGSTHRSELDSACAFIDTLNKVEAPAAAKLMECPCWCRYLTK